MLSWHPSGAPVRISRIDGHATLQDAERADGVEIPETGTIYLSIMPRGGWREGPWMRAARAARCPLIVDAEVGEVLAWWRTWTREHSHLIRSAD